MGHSSEKLEGVWPHDPEKADVAVQVFLNLLTAGQRRAIRETRSCALDDPTGRYDEQGNPRIENVNGES